MKDRTEIAIVGAGQVGLTLAVALRRAAPKLDVTLIDARPVAALKSDPRATAIGPAARRMFERLGLWPGLAGRAQPVNEMIATDSQVEAALRPVYLSMTSGANAEPGAPIAHMVDNADLTGALLALATDLGVTFAPPAPISGLDLEPRPRLTLADGGRIDARLVVAADGMRSALRGFAGIRPVVIDHGQAAIAITVVHERPHDGLAEDHFLPAGPFAVLPLADDRDGRHRSSVIWVETEATARALVDGDDFTFRLELERRFGHRLGALTPPGRPRAFPLQLSLVRDWVRPGFALAGDAAHAIHPVAGIGLNLGLADAAALAEVIVDALRLGLDPGRLEILERYQAWRRAETAFTGLAAGLLDRVFSNDVTPIRLARDLGLGILDRMPALKSRLAERGPGASPSLPRLMAGTDI